MSHSSAESEYPDRAKQGRNEFQQFLMQQIFAGKNNGMDGGRTGSDFFKSSPNRDYDPDEDSDFDKQSVVSKNPVVLPKQNRQSSSSISEARSSSDQQVMYQPGDPLGQVMRLADENRQDKFVEGIFKEGQERDRPRQSSVGLLNEIDNAEAQKWTPQAGGQTMLDPRYVKESKRNLFSKMLLPTPQTQKAERGKADKAKGFFSGLGEFGLWALTGFGVIPGIASGVKKIQKNWARKNAKSYSDRAAQATTDAEKVRLDSQAGAYLRSAEEHKLEQLMYGRYGSGYDWRKRMGRWALTSAERKAQDDYVGEEDTSWRTARDQSQAMESGGGRFNREKLSATKQVLAAEKALAKAKAKGLDAPKIQELEEHKAVAMKSLTHATVRADRMASTQIARNTARNTNRNTNRNTSRGGLNFNMNFDKPFDAQPQMDLIREEEDDESDE